ncbi:hypothetical protein K502DRAFT_322908 [Neoconidiobolus thromboides FSU 785]|nr:hypothetical protein K502DRAFT_322908 [Neoconidiobolus thromboides FSU 785]
MIYFKFTSIVLIFTQLSYYTYLYFLTFKTDTSTSIALSVFYVINSSIIFIGLNSTIKGDHTILGYYVKYCLYGLISLTGLSSYYIINQVKQITQVCDSYINFESTYNQCQHLFISENIAIYQRVGLFFILKFLCYFITRSYLYQLQKKLILEKASYNDAKTVYPVYVYVDMAEKN